MNAAATVVARYAVDEQDAALLMRMLGLDSDTSATAPPVRSGPDPCGTNGAYHRHRVAREEACRPCKDAHAAYLRGRRR